MRISLTILIFFSLFLTKAQEKVTLKGLTKKDIKALKKQENEKKRITKLTSMGLNQWGIDENAQTWYLALKHYLPTARQAGGLPILRQYQTFTQESSKIFPLWIINGQRFSSPPQDVQTLSPHIRKVKVLINAAETNRWGKEGRAGVVMLTTIEL